MQLTEDPVFREKLEELKARILGNVSSPILIYGESGVGKSVIARWIHRIHPARQRGPLVIVPSGSMSSELVESKLFGHVRGAFTSAFADRPGAFELADGGVLQIDDLDALSESTQAKLLQAVQEGIVERVGPPGVFVQVQPGMTGLIPGSEIGHGVDAADAYPAGKKVAVKVIGLDVGRKRIALSAEGAKESAMHGDYLEYQAKTEAAESKSAMALALEKALGKK